MNKLRVAHVFWGLGYGGIETMLVNIANAQAQYGADVHIVLINKLYEQALLDRLDIRVKVHSLNRKLGSKSLFFIWQLNKELRMIKPDKIHLHGPEFYAMILNKDLRSKTGLTIHDLPINMQEHWSRWKTITALMTCGIKYSIHLVRVIPKLFAISEAVRVKFQENYGVNSVVVCNGILTANFAQRTQDRAKRPYKLVQVSRLYHEKKGQDLLMEAVACMDDVEVSFIGDGESMDYLKKLASELRINQRVHFLGAQSQEYISMHIKDYDLFVQPSRREGFGLTVAEAMAANVPVLVSAGQGPAEITEGDMYGWVFENGDVKDLASMIKYIFSHYDEAMAKSEKAREHVRLNYDVSVTAKRYLDMY